MEFLTCGYKTSLILSKNEWSSRKLLYFENWANFVPASQKLHNPTELAYTLCIHLPKIKLRSSVRLFSPRLISNFWCFLEKLTLSDKVKYKHMIGKLESWFLNSNNLTFENKDKSIILNLAILKTLLNFHKHDEMVLLEFWN